MSDREKVLRGLKACARECFTASCLKAECPYLDDDNCTGVMARDALELLKEQEPVKVKHHDISNADDTTFDDEFWCEGCGTMWQAAKEEVNFCPGCGKAVKWDD